MEFGFYLPNSGEGAQPDALASIAGLGDRLGFYCMVAPDHILMPRNVDSVYPYSVTGNILAGGNSGAGEWPEQITTLAYLAGVTESIRLVTSVMIVPYRNPLLCAKMLATLDMLSKAGLSSAPGWAGWRKSSSCWTRRPSPSGARPPTSTCGRSSSYGLPTIPASRANTSTFPT